MITTATNVPYSQRKREAVAQAIPDLALGATDAYVAAAQLKGLGGAEASGVFSVLSGGLAVMHAGKAIWHLNNTGDKVPAAENKRRQAMAIGEVITAVGFAGMTFGLGLWAIPVVALGELTTNYARFT